MIVRIWHGRTPADKGDDYLDYLKRTGVTNYRATEGNRGVYVLRSSENGVADFLLISLWESMDSVRAFAGDSTMTRFRFLLLFRFAKSMPRLLLVYARSMLSHSSSYQPDAPFLLTLALRERC